MDIILKRSRIYFLLWFVHVTESFYLPGLAPVSFCKDAERNDKCKVDFFLTQHLSQSLNLNDRTPLFSGLGLTSNLKDETKNLWGKGVPYLDLSANII